MYIEPETNLMCYFSGVNHHSSGWLDLGIHHFSSPHPMMGLQVQTSMPDAAFQWILKIKLISSYLHSTQPTKLSS